MSTHEERMAELKRQSDRLDRHIEHTDTLMWGMCIFFFWIFVPLYVTGWIGQRIAGALGLWQKPER